MSSYCGMNFQEKYEKEEMQMTWPIRKSLSKASSCFQKISEYLYNLPEIALCMEHAWRMQHFNRLEHLIKFPSLENASTNMGQVKCIVFSKTKSSTRRVYYPFTNHALPIVLFHQKDTFIFEFSHVFAIFQNSNIQTTLVYSVYS